MAKLKRGGSRTFRTAAGLWAMLRKMLAAMAALVGVSVCAPAFAAVILVGSTSNATGVDGLVIGGQTYDVSFVGGTYGGVFSGQTPTFFNDPIGAAGADAALVAALESLDVSFVTNHSTSFYVPSSVGPIGIADGGLDILTGLPLWIATPPQLISNNTKGDWAVFTLASSPAPEPAEWVLMLLGLGGLGLTLRPRRLAPAIA